MTVLVATTVGVVLLFAAAQARTLRGRFGDDDLPFTFDFGNDWMVVTIGAPAIPNAHFRPTSNLHVFTVGLVAMKSDDVKECYVQRFYESENELRGRVTNAVSTNGQLGNVVEERLSVEGLKPLDEEFYPLLGKRIIRFCGDYKVYVLKDLLNYPHTPKDVQRRKRAAASSFNVARACIEQL